MSNVVKGEVLITAPGAQKTFDGIANGVAKTEVALKGLKPAASQATLAMTNLGRVVQDAPYGFIGIANNLNPFLESFQRLRASAGSGGAALKAFGASLLGAGGIGLGLSIVTSLLVGFSGRMSKAKEETEATKKSTDEAAKKQNEFKQAIDSASSSIISQADKLTDLRSALTSAAKDMDDLTAATINQGVARLIFTQKESSIQKALSAEIERQFLLRSRSAGVLKSTEFISDPQLDNLEKGYQAMLKLGRNDTELKKTIDRLKELNKVKGDEGGVVNFLNSISKGFENIFKSFIKAPPTPEGFDLDKWVKEWLTKFPKITAPLPLEFSINLDEVRFVLLGGDIKTFQEQINENINKQISKLVVAPRFHFSAEFLASRENQQAVIDAANKLAGSFANAMGSSLSDSFVAIGEGIGNILSGEDFGNQIFQVFGDLLQQLGKALIQFALVDAVIKKILANPLTLPAGIALAAGIAAIAAGALLKNVTGRRAAGGPVGAGQTYLVGEKGPELFTPNTGGNIVANHDLVGGSFGSGAGMNLQLSGAFQVNGNDLVLVLARANQSQRRLTGR